MRYESSSIIPGEPRDPLSVHKSTLRSSRIPIHYQLRFIFKPQGDGIHTAIEWKKRTKEERDGFMLMKLEESSTIESHPEVAITTRRHARKKTRTPHTRYHLVRVNLVCIYKEDVVPISLVGISHFVSQDSLHVLTQIRQCSLVLLVQPIIPYPHHHDHKAQRR